MNYCRLEKLAIRSFLAAILIYVTVAPYVWWQKAASDLDTYKVILQGTNNELQAMELHVGCDLLPPPLPYNKEDI